MDDYPFIFSYYHCDHMGCTRSTLTEIPRCEPITSFGWLASWSSCLVGEQIHPWYCLRTYILANSVCWETAQEKDRYQFTPKRWTRFCPWFWQIKRYVRKNQKHVTHWVIRCAKKNCRCDNNENDARGSRFCRRYVCHKEMCIEGEIEMWHFGHSDLKFSI